MICKQHSYTGKYPCPSCSSGEGETFMGEPAIQKTVPISRELIHQMHRAAGCSGNMTFDEVVKAALGRLLAHPVASEPVAWLTGEVVWSGEASARNHARAHRLVVEPLYRHPPAPVIPKGYALVPIDPTPEMIMAGIDNNPTSRNEDTDQGFPAQIANDVYRAMLSAALQPTEGSTDD